MDGLPWLRSLPARDNNCRPEREEITSLYYLKCKTVLRVLLRWHRIGMSPESRRTMHIFMDLAAVRVHDDEIGHY